MRFTTAILLIFLLKIQTRVVSQDLSQKFAETITASDLKAHLSIIASDSFEGRNTGEKGQKLAASYISNHFKSLGLKPVVQKGDSFSYFQTFNVFKKSWDNPVLRIDGKEKKFLQDFFSLANPEFEKEEELEVVFGGFGLEDLNKQNINIKDKAVVMFLGKVEEKNHEARASKINNLISASNFSRKYREILENGAKAVFIIPADNDSVFQNFLNKNKCKMEEPDIYMNSKIEVRNNLFYIPFSLGAEVLNLNGSELQKIYSRTELTPNDLKKIKPKNITIRASKKVETLETENVLGFLEGTDKKDEVLVITAHYDHEGILCGEIYNGADDDGSGTSAILEMAEAFTLAKKEGKPNRRSILFMTVTGEEKGLLGSLYYTRNPVFPLSQTFANLNIDMIGRIDKFHDNEDYVYLIGSDRLSSDLHQISEEVNLKYTDMFLDYKYNALDDPNKFYYRSDHYNFAKNNIPVIFYFSGVHEDYHKPTDDIEKILFNKVEKTTKLIFHTAWELVNREERIAVDVK